MVIVLVCLGRPSTTSALSLVDISSYQVEAYRRPYGSNAPWNMPAAGLPRHPQSDVYRDRLWNDAPADRAGNFNLNFGYGGYTYPVYYASDATGEFPVQTSWETNIDGKRIPWSPEWVPAAGSDAQIIILDSQRGYEWNLWQVSFDGTTVHATNGNLVQEGEGRGDGSSPANYWTKENGFSPSRGCGIQYFAMLVVPEEIMQGEIRHALSMPIINTDGEFYVPPATKLEYPDHPPDGIPEGMRFALQIDDAGIEAWIASLPAGLPQTTRNSARIIARALRDYGWFITDSSGGAQLQFEDYHTAGDEWRALGLDERTLDWIEYPRDLLDGLVTQDRIYALVPSDQYPPTPASTFADVPSTHPYYSEIEALYRAGYTAGCATNPLLYCPEQTMNRAESAVFVERGIHSASYTPVDPSAQVFTDLPLDSWAAGWINSLWEDHYTSGCGTDPLLYCPSLGHTRAEGSVFYLRMLNGAGFEPPQPTRQTFADVSLDTWYARWVEAAYDAALIEPCQIAPELRFCPNDPLTRALAAFMMVRAKGIPWDP